VLRAPTSTSTTSCKCAAPCTPSLLPPLIQPCAPALTQPKYPLALARTRYPTFFVLLLAGVVSQCCAAVFECTITTIFVSCFRDNALYRGEHMPEQLRKAFGIQRAAAETEALKGGKPKQGKAEPTDAELES